MNRKPALQSQKSSVDKPFVCSRFFIRSVDRHKTKQRVLDSIICNASDKKKQEQDCILKSIGALMLFTCDVAIMRTETKRFCCSYFSIFLVDMEEFETSTQRKENFSFNNTIR